MGNGRYREVDNNTGTITIVEREESRERPRIEGRRRPEQQHRRSEGSRATALRAIAHILRYVDDEQE